MERAPIGHKYRLFQRGQRGSGTQLIPFIAGAGMRPSSCRAGRLEIPSGVSSGLHHGRVRSLENSLEANHADDSRSISEANRYPRRSWRNFRLVGIEQINVAGDGAVAM